MAGVLKVKVGGAWVPANGSSTHTHSQSEIINLSQGVSLGHTTAQSIPHNTATAVIFDTEYFDTSGFHGTGSRITIPAGLAGRYLVNYYFAFYASAGGTKRLGYIRRNGSASDQIAPSLGFGSASYVGQLDGTTILDLIAGDYIEVIAYHDQGAALPLQGNDAASHIIEFSAIRMPG